MKRLVFGDGSGRINSIMSEHLSTGGKRLRARLALAATSALGGLRRQAVGWAAAVELIHNATLIHDDIQDKDEFRRGHATVWSKYGLNEAINAGDLMMMLPFSAIQEVPERMVDGVSLRWLLTMALARATQTVVRGQSHEQRLILLCDGPEGERAYMECASQKTGALLAVTIYGAALLAGCPDMVAQQLATEFEPVGMLFQIQDDVLDLFGDKGRRRRGQDLQEGKVSLLVIEHLRLYPEDRDWLLEKLSRPRGQLSDGEANEIIATFEGDGALNNAIDRMEMLVSRMRESKNLARFPNLYFLANETIEMILEPIKAVLQGRMQTRII